LYWAAKGKTPIKFVDLGKGFVHVLDKISLNVILGELDTIKDFVKYLSAKERLYLSGEKQYSTVGKKTF